MALKLSTKISVVILGIASMAIVDSGVAVFSITRVKAIMDAAVDENFSTIRAADQLHVALLRQNALVRNYVLDSGNAEWLKRIADAEEQFDRWLAEAHRTAFTSKEAEILKELEACYRRYQEERDKVLALYKAGDTVRAKERSVQDLSPLYGQTKKQCEALAVANQDLIEAQMERARKSRDWATWAVVLSASVTLALTGGLVGLFFRNIFNPLRRMLDELRIFARGSRPAEDGPEDEMRLIGRYLRNLMTDTATSRSTAEVEHAAKLAAVGQLATRVSHEIRSPLDSIRLKLQDLRKTTAGLPELPRELDAIDADVDRLDRSMHQFLDFSRPPLLHLHPQPCCPILAKAVEFVRQRLPEHGVELIYECHERLPFVAADHERLEQVFLNLLRNALEASPDHTRITVTAQVERDAQDREMVVVRFTDNGPGISPEMQERIFEPFFTTKREGTGLGLCIAAQVIAGHSGSLVLESSGDNGTTFAVRLPVAAQWFP